MLRITQTVYNEMIQDSQERAPNEACGLLSGKDDVATACTSMTNTEKSPVRYWMDPKEQFRVMKTIRSRGEKMLAIYHSHVATQAYPSATDVDLALYPEVHYVIISLENQNTPAARVFRIEKRRIREEPLEIAA